MHLPQYASPSEEDMDEDGDEESEEGPAPAPQPPPQMIPRQVVHCHDITILGTGFTVPSASIPRAVAGLRCRVIYVHASKSSSPLKHPCLKGSRDLGECDHTYTR